MTGERKQTFNMARIGVILGVVFVIVPIVFAAVTFFFRNEPENEVTWVG